MTFLHSLIIALMNGCKVAAGRQEEVCVCGGVRGRYRQEDGEKGGEGKERRGWMERGVAIHCN